MRIIGDRQQVTGKHHLGLDSARDEASGGRSLDRVPDPDLGMTVGLPNQALGLVESPVRQRGLPDGATVLVSAA